MFGDLFGGGAPRGSSSAAPQKGADVETTATISFTDAIDGVTITLRLTSDAPCPDCSGTGGKPGTKPHICPECEGAGFVVARPSAARSRSTRPARPAAAGSSLRRAVPDLPRHAAGACPPAPSRPASPPGVKDGQRIRLRGKGGAGENGGPAGDLYVTVKVSPHRLFGRKGDNLTLDVPVSFDEAALGAEIKVPTLGGRPGHAQDPRRAPPTAAPSGCAARARAAADGTNGDLLVTVRGAGARGARPGRPRGGRGLPRRDRRQAAARQALRGSLT